MYIHAIKLFVLFFVTAILLYHYSGLGITAGAHRLWAHRSYKAKFPLRLILVIANTLAFEVLVYFYYLFQYLNICKSVYLFLLNLFSM